MKRLNPAMLVVISAIAIGAVFAVRHACKKEDAQGRKHAAHALSATQKKAGVTSAMDQQIKDIIQRREVVAVGLKDGKRLVAKITGETKSAVFLSCPGKSGENSVDRKSILSIKKPGAGELMAFNFIRMKECLVTHVKSLGKTREAIDSWVKYQREVQSAKRAKSELSARLAKEMREDAKKAGKVIPGMTQADVESILGYPDNIESADDGNGGVVKWFYKKSGTVIFRDGKVAKE